MADNYEGLEKLFHEPARLAIVSELCGAEEGMSFVQMKEKCGLTDGNLSRHLAVLKEAKVVQIKKSFVDSKPRTTVMITEKGLEQFFAYLDALEKVLKEAAKKAKPVRAKLGETLARSVGC